MNYLIRDTMLRLHKHINKVLAVYIAMLATGMLTGCEVDSFFDPSKAGYWERTPTTVPILERIDIIEGSNDKWANATPVTPADLLPSVLEYRLAGGDVVTVEIHDFPLVGQVSSSVRRIDQSGNVRLPSPVRDIAAAGLTLLELEDSVIATLQQGGFRDPLVIINLNDGRGFTYALDGNIPRPALYSISKPDFRISEALAQAGGVPFNSNRIFVIRPIALDEQIRSPYGERTQPTQPSDNDQPIDIENLIEQLPGKDNGNGSSSLDLDSDAESGISDFQPTLLAAEPAIDIDDYNPANSRRFGSANGNTAYVFVEEKGEWVEVNAQDDIADDVMLGNEDLVLERIIEIPADKLLSDSSYNIVVRPGDRIYVEPPEFGVVYVAGEVLRVGTYNLPQLGRMTLSQLVTAAGGPGPLAIPDRVDLTRRIGENREATIRVSLAAIRQKNEPDIFIKADDHIIIGTSWVAQPLAIIRNGFRATYGFGFLLDRNFGNDVFGAPPRNFGR